MDLYERSQPPSLAPVLSAQMKKAVGRIVERKSGRKLKATTIYLPVPLHSRLRRYADREGREVSTLVAKLLTSYLDEHDG